MISLLRCSMPAARSMKKESFCFSLFAPLRRGSPLPVPQISQSGMLGHLPRGSARTTAYYENDDPGYLRDAVDATDGGREPGSNPAHRPERASPSEPSSASMTTVCSAAGAAKRLPAPGRPLRCLELLLFAVLDYAPMNRKKAITGLLDDGVRLLVADGPHIVPSDEPKRLPEAA
jgi:hypothetical protein